MLTPIETCGIAMVSMGLLIAENQPVIWRGPMLNGIIRQFLYQVAWGERDVVVVDLPQAPAMPSSAWPRPFPWLA